MFEKLVTHNNPDVDIVSEYEYTKFCPFILNIMSKTQIMTSMEGHISVANLQKMTLYNLGQIGLELWFPWQQIAPIGL